MGSSLQNSMMSSPKPYAAGASSDRRDGGAWHQPLSRHSPVPQRSASAQVEVNKLRRAKCNATSKSAGTGLDKPSKRTSRHPSATATIINNLPSPDDTHDLANCLSA